MILLLIFSFLAGIVTILSPCILPILPIVLSGGVGGGRRKPLGIIIGFILSFTFFTLFLTTIVKLTGVSADALRTISVIIIFLFGISLLIPGFQILSERLFTKLSGLISTSGSHQGFWGGLLIGLSVGLVWTPCVGPIIASVITLAATSSVNFAAFFITLAYSLGTAIPMFAIMIGGRGLLQKNQWLLRNAGIIQKVFGILMILTALAIFFQIDRKFQTYVLDTFPQYGVGLTKLEDNSFVSDELKKLQGSEGNIVGQPDAPEIVPGGEWFNLPSGKKSLTIADLKGKVVLIDFWTYTCINCIRTLPYLKEWDKKYRDKGLVIIGVHTPEFEFEKNPENVGKAITDFGLQYPIIQDNEYATWRAYLNQYWPAKYFIDKNGKIRSFHFGEGEYDESEKLIQQLLQEAGSDVSRIKIANPEYSVETNTPETYLGYGRIDNFVSPEKIAENKLANYTIPSFQRASSFAYGGKWLVGEEYALSTQNAELVFHYEAKNVFLVMRSIDGKPSRVKVFLDGEVIPQSYRGKDVIDGVVTVTTDRLYELVTSPFMERHVLKLQFLDGNIEVYAFTFG